MRHGIDTGFLVAAEVAEHPDHASARLKLAERLTAGDRFALAPQVLAEFIHIVTDPRRFVQPLLERRRDTLVRHVEALRVTRRERPFHIDAWVVLPDHRHCVWTLPAGDDDFSNRWKAR